MSRSRSSREVLRRVAAALDRRRARPARCGGRGRRAAPANGMLTPLLLTGAVPMPEITGIDTDAGLRRMMGNAEQYLGLLRKFAERHEIVRRELARRAGGRRSRNGGTGRAYTARRRRHDRRRSAGVAGQTGRGPAAGRRRAARHRRRTQPAGRHARRADRRAARQAAAAGGAGAAAGGRRHPTASGSPTASRKFAALLGAQRCRGDQLLNGKFRRCCATRSASISARSKPRPRASISRPRSAPCSGPRKISKSCCCQGRCSPGYCLPGRCRQGAARHTTDG